MANHHYSNDALVGNWFEDRLDASTAPIPELERTGKFRVTPLKMADNGPEQYVTTNQLYHHRLAPLQAPPPPQLISKQTMHLALHDRLPPADSRPYGFGAVRPRHEPDHDKRRFETTTHSTYGGRYADTPERQRDVNEGMQAVQHSIPAGRVLRDGASGGIRTGGSTDERLQLGDTDPKSHTFVQRTWLGHDGHSQYVLRGDEYAATRAAHAAQASHSSVPGLSPTAGMTPSSQVAHGQKFYRRNDTLKRSTGIWNE